MRAPGLRFVTYLILTAAVVVPAAADNSDFEDFGELTLEDLLAQPVVTASRTEQQLRESPMSVTVISRDQMLRSGARSIPEALQLVSGLEVMATAPGGYDVSARGMAENGANTMLVMVDGRSVYADFYGLTLWEFIPNDLAEIESVEVIRGPGSALYGANAFAGVINIITRQPEDFEGSVTRVAGGTQSTRSLGVVHADRQGNLAYKVSAGLEALEPRLETSPEDAANVDRVHGSLSYQLEGGGTLRASGGYTDGVTQTVPTSFTAGVDFDARTSYLRTDYEAESWWFRSFWNRSKMDIVASDLAAPVGVIGLDESVLDMETQREFELSEQQHLILGTSYRYKSVSWEGLDVTRQHLVAVFAQHELRPADRWILSLGLRYDHHPLVKGHVAPRLGAVYTPNDAHVFRASAGIAYRNPAYVENYWSTMVDIGPGLSTVISGKEDLASESLQSFEVGYQGLLRSDLMAGMSIYHNRIRDIVSLDVSDRFPSPPAPVPGIPSLIEFQNTQGINATGTEADLIFELSDAWNVRAAYSFVYATDSSSGERVGHVTRHRASVDLGWRADRLTTNLRARYVGSSSWSLEPNGLPTTVSSAGDYVSFDARAAVKVWDNDTELAVTATNLLDRNFRDYPLGYRNERRVLASLILGF